MPPLPALDRPGPSIRVGSRRWFLEVGLGGLGLGGLGGLALLPQSPSGLACPQDGPPVRPRRQPKAPPTAPDRAKTAAAAVAGPPNGAAALVGPQRPAAAALSTPRSTFAYCNTATLHSCSTGLLQPGNMGVCRYCIM